MKLTSEIKKQIDDFFDSISPEELIEKLEKYGWTFENADKEQSIELQQFPYIIWNNGDGSASVKFYESIELRDIVAEIYIDDYYETGTLEIGGSNVEIIDTNSEYRGCNEYGKIITKEEVLFNLFETNGIKEANSIIHLFSNDVRSINITIGNKVKFIWSHGEYYEVFFDGILVGHRPANINPEEIIERIKENFNKIINYESDE